MQQPHTRESVNYPPICIVRCLKSNFCNQAPRWKIYLFLKLYFQTGSPQCDGWSRFQFSVKLCFDFMWTKHCPNKLDDLCFLHCSIFDMMMMTMMLLMMMMTMISIDGNKGQTEQRAFEVSDELLLVVDLSSRDDDDHDDDDHHHHHHHHKWIDNGYLYLVFPARTWNIVFVFVLLYFQTGLTTWNCPTLPMNGYGPKIRPPTPSTKKTTYTYNKNRTIYTYNKNKATYNLKKDHLHIQQK